MNNKKVITVLTTVCFLLVSPAISIGFDQDQLIKRIELFERLTRVCEESLETICTQEDGRERMQCLFDNYEETSEDCQSTLTEMGRHRSTGEHGSSEEMRQDVQEACGESIETICSEETGMEGIWCLEEIYDETSPDCQDVLDEVPVEGKGGSVNAPSQFIILTW